jgi:hypothetical protein
LYPYDNSEYGNIIEQEPQDSLRAAHIHAIQIERARAKGTREKTAEEIFTLDDYTNGNINYDDIIGKMKEYANQFKPKDTEMSTQPKERGMQERGSELWDKLSILISSEKDCKELHGYKVIMESDFKEWYAAHLSNK